MLIFEYKAVHLKKTQTKIKHYTKKNHRGTIVGASAVLLQFFGVIKVIYSTTAVQRTC